MADDRAHVMPIRRARASVSTSFSRNSSQGRDSSDDSTAMLRKHPRKGMPKVRTGCITCKIRRVKCDETKPECSRCTSTGRKCDGYAAPTPRRASAKGRGVFSIIPALVFEQGEQAERRALEYFKTRSAPSFSGHFDAEFWSRIVLQIGQSEPAIWHAMVALGALNEQRDRQTKKMPVKAMLVTDPMGADVPRLPVQPQENDPLALVHYNKAISHLSERMRSATSDTTDIALLACILFVAVEMLRGDDCPAMKHVTSGMGIAIGNLNNRDGPYSQLQTMRESVLPFFDRLELLSMVFGRDPTWDYPVPLAQAIPAKFDTISQTRNSLVHVLNLSIRFMRTVRFKRYDNSASAEDIVNYHNHLDALAQWRAVFDQYLETDGSAMLDSDAAKILEIHRLVVLAWVRSCLEPEETAHDRDIPAFTTAVELAESLQNSAQRREQRAESTSSFTFDMELVAPLYLLAIKCRHPQVRRRAIALLHSGVRREGLWDSQVTAAVAERVMELEEVDLTSRDGSELPAEGLRIHNIHIENSPVLSFSLHNLTYYSRSGGSWKIWNEQLVLQCIDEASGGAGVIDQKEGLSLHWKFPLEEVRSVHSDLCHPCEIAGGGYGPKYKGVEAGGRGSRGGNDSFSVGRI